MEELLSLLSKFLSLCLSVRYALEKVQHLVPKFSQNVCNICPYDVITVHRNRKKSKYIHTYTYV